MKTEVWTMTVDNPTEAEHLICPICDKECELRTWNAITFHGQKATITGLTCVTPNCSGNLAEFCERHVEEFEKRAS